MHIGFKVKPTIGGGGGGGISLVQSRMGSNVHSLAYNSAVTAGNTLVVCHTGWPGGGANFTSASDSVNGSHTLLLSADVQQDTRIMMSAYASTGSGTPTVSHSPTGGDGTLWIGELSGLNTSSLVATAAASSSGSGTAVALSATGTLEVGDLIIAFMSHAGSNPSITHDSADGFTNAGELEDGNSYMPLAVQYLVAVGTTSITPNYTLSGSSPWFGARVVLNKA